MKKSHLLWKILVVVMIVSAMMATFVACGHDCAKDGHIDENGDYWCDACGAAIQHQHADANRDRKCDLCGADVDPCGLGNHVDADNNHRCDECTRIFGAEEGWNNFFADLDKVVDSMGTMGDLATMGGNVTANISFDQAAYTDKEGNKTEASSHDIEVKVDFGLDLATEFDDTLAASGSENAFGVTITDTVGETTTTLLGLWYVDNGSAAAEGNYILAKFGEEVFKISAPSLAETFATYPIDVNVNITDKVNEVGAIDASSVTSIVAGILPLDVKSTATSTTYSIALTDYLFNEVTPPMTDAAYGIGGLLSQGLSTIPAITKVLNAIGIGSDLLSTLDALLPGLTLDVTFNKDAAGNTTGAAIGIGIAGEAMSVELYHPESGKTDGLIYDIFKTEADEGNGTIIINDGFGDITLDVALSYEFGSNAEQAGFPYSAAVKEAFDKANTDYGAEAREIGLLNVAFEGEVLLGMGGEAKTYSIKVAADLDPSVMTDEALLKEVVKVNDQGQGLWTDKNGNKKYDAGEEDTTVAINFNSEEKNTVDVVLSMIDKLYLNISNDEGGLTVIKAGETKYDEKTGKVSDFPIVIKGISWLGNLLDTFLDDKAMETVDKLIGEGALISGDMGTLEDPTNLAGLPIASVLSTIIKVNGVADLGTVEAWAPYVEPSTGGDNTGDNTGDSGEGGFDISKLGPILEDVVRYIEMFKFNRVDKDTLTLTVNETNMNNAGVSFEATAKVTRDTDDTLKSLTLSLGADGLVINGSDKVNTTIKMVDGWPLLQIGGEGNLFKAAVSVSQTGTTSPLNLTLGINLKKVGYGLVNSYITTDAEFEAMFSEANEKLFISSTAIASATE